jgi:hypothetical protein
MIPFLVLACKLKFLIDHFCNTQEYADFLQEFMTAVKQNYGEKVLIQVKHTQKSSISCSGVGL